MCAGRVELILLAQDAGQAGVRHDAALLRQIGVSPRQHLTIHRLRARQAALQHQNVTEECGSRQLDIMSAIVLAECDSVFEGAGSSRDVASIDVRGAETEGHRAAPGAVIRQVLQRLMGEVAAERRFAARCCNHRL